MSALQRPHRPTLLWHQESVDWLVDKALNSSYTGSGQPVNTLTVMVSDTATSETSGPQTIKVTDPPPGEVSPAVAPSQTLNRTRGWQIADLSGVHNFADGPFAAHRTLGGAGNADTGNDPINTAHTANMALFRNYMAASFASLSDGHGGTPVAPSSAVADTYLQLAHPHA